ncbi:MAG: hypothetical protein IJU75_05945, partial [Clostridia bacterium]|nr:hypothetical protein [Clostridia bacterium]
MKKTNRLLSGVIAFAIVLGMFVMPLNAAAGPATLQPAEGERIPVLTGKDDNGGPGVGGFVQKPRFTDNGDGTYSVVTGHDGWYASWTDDKYSEGQWTNQDNGSAQWNYYFPRVYYPEGVKAVELAWGLMSLGDAADLADYEIYYSSDAVTWTKTTAFTMYLYTPFIYHQEGNEYVIDLQELGSSNGSSVGVRFVFDEAIEAKYFFAYDPDPAFENIQHWCGYFVACEAPSAAEPLDFNEVGNYIADADFDASDYGDAIIDVVSDAGSTGHAGDNVLNFGTGEYCLKKDSYVWYTFTAPEAGIYTVAVKLRAKTGVPRAFNIGMDCDPSDASTQIQGIVPDAFYGDDDSRLYAVIDASLTAGEHTFYILTATDFDDSTIKSVDVYNVAIYAPKASSAVAPDTLQPAEGERIPVLTGKDDNGGPGVGGFVQKPRFT